MSSYDPSSCLKLGLEDAAYNYKYNMLFSLAKVDVTRRKIGENEFVELAVMAWGEVWRTWAYLNDELPRSFTSKKKLPSVVTLLYTNGYLYIGTSIRKGKGAPWLTTMPSDLTYNTLRTEMRMKAAIDPAEEHRSNAHCGEMNVFHHWAIENNADSFDKLIDSKPLLVTIAEEDAIPYIEPPYERKAGKPGCEHLLECLSIKSIADHQGPPLQSFLKEFTPREGVVITPCDHLSAFVPGRIIQK